MNWSALFGFGMAYHAIGRGFYQGELLRRIDPRHRSPGQFFQDEIAIPLGLKRLFLAAGVDLKLAHARPGWFEIPAGGFGKPVAQPDKRHEVRALIQPFPQNVALTPKEFCFREIAIRFTSLFREENRSGFQLLKVHESGRGVQVIEMRGIPKLHRAYRVKEAGEKDVHIQFRYLPGGWHKAGHGPGNAGGHAPILHQDLGKVVEFGHG